MKVRCPHCKSPLEILPDIKSDEIVCPSCGSSLNGVNETLISLSPDKRLIGRFQLIEMVGRGYFGEVWRANDTDLRRTVAIKLPRTADLTGDHRERFLREAKAAAQLRHPNIVSVHEVGTDGATMFIVSDFIRGMTLGELILTRRPGPREAAELCRKLAEALHHAHEAGVVHRDLKPSNIMIEPSGQPILMDFGLAKQEAGEFTMTVSGDILGTPAYMSPEQARGDSHLADRRSDVYSLGVVLYELLTGERPFKGATHLLLKAIQMTEPSPPSRIQRHVPRDLETICLKAMSKEPHLRYETARDMADDLRRFLNGETIVGRRASTVEKSWRWARRNPMLATASSAACLAIVALGMVWWHSAATARVMEDRYRAAVVGTPPRLTNPDTPIKFFERSPTVIAWRTDVGQSAPEFDPELRSYTTHSGHDILLARTAIHSGPTILDATVSILDDLGAAGFFWGLHTTPRDGVRRCFVVYLRRFRPDKPWELCHEEIQFEDRGGDRLAIRQTLSYDVKPIELPRIDQARLVVEVTTKKVIVRLNSDVVWEPITDEWAAPWLPAVSREWELGVLGRGRSVTFQKALARALK